MKIFKIVSMFLVSSSLFASSEYKIISGFYTEINHKNCAVMLDKNGDELIITFANDPKVSVECPTPFTSFASKTTTLNLYQGKDNGGTYQIMILESGNIMMREVRNTSFGNWFRYINTISCK